MSHDAEKKIRLCIQCENEALKDSDFCAVCEEREFKKNSWLAILASNRTGFNNSRQYDLY